MRKRVAIVLAFAILVLSHAATAELDQNFPDRKAIILNTCPFVELSDFSYHNFYANSATRFAQDLKWKNTGTQPLVAIEIVVLKYDPFDRRLIGSRWIVTGKNSADWSPLQPGESNGDGTRGYGEEEVYTAIAYVRSARLQDGTVWRVNEGTLLAEIKKAAPSVTKFGDLDADPEPPKQQPKQ